MRYYYKKENAFYSVKAPILEEGYEEITEQEFNEHIIPKSEEDFVQTEILKLKLELSSSDYQALKYMEGWLTEEEYAPIKAHRQKLRNKINELEAITY